MQKSLRLWPGVAAAILLLLFKFIVPMVIPDALPVAMFGGLFLGLVVIVWWAFFSRAHWIERVGAVVLMIVGLIAVRPFLHESIAKAGVGLLFPILAIPMLALVFVVWAVATSRLSTGLRRVTMIAAILLACGGWAAIRTGGVNHSGQSDIAFRWAESPEQRLLNQAGDEPMALPTAPAAAVKEAEWPGFRGLHRDSVIRGVRIETDWSSSPPAELWRRPIGPGWSSFAVSGDLFYTQEQRGDEEFVSCYYMSTGDPAWRHRHAARFWESNSGAGPRATPTLSNGRVYALGATGIMNVLDAADGTVVWSRNAASDTEMSVPYWGISGSPLVVDDVVIVPVSASLIAYDLLTGEPRWLKKAEGDCYSSPHLLVVDGVKQILFQNDTGTSSIEPSDGKLIWEHPWPGLPIVQPTLTADGDVLVSAGEKSGVRRITVSQESDGLAVKERWTSARLKPYFNDSVIHNGHAYGFDGPFLGCIDVENGERRWRGGRYGRGQLVLVADQDLLLVLSEKGELALVKAAPEAFMELARMPAIEGKTWNHPVLVGDILLVRNGQEMAAFRLSLASG